MKLVERELGPHHVSCDIGCHLFSILPPFNIGATTMGYGLGWAGAAALNAKDANRRTISVMGDGGFWHNGLASSVGNAVFNKTDNVLVVVDNYYSAATGGQDILSSRATSRRNTGNPIARAVRGVGCDMGARGHPHLRPDAHGRRAARGADHAGKGPEGHRRVVRMHAEPPAPRTAADGEGRARGKTRRARPFRRR